MTAPRLLIFFVCFICFSSAANPLSVAHRCLTQQRAFFQQMPKTLQALATRCEAKISEAQEAYKAVISQHQQDYLRRFNDALRRGDYTYPSLHFHKTRDRQAMHYACEEGLEATQLVCLNQTRETAIRWLRRLSLDNAIKVVATHSQYSPFSASILCRQIGISCCFQFPSEESEFCLLHEIAHHLHQDCLPAAQIDPPKEYFILRQAREERADTWAALLGGKAVTRAGIAWLSSLPPCNNTTHPAPQIRIASLEEALQVLQKT